MSSSHQAAEEMVADMESMPGYSCLLDGDRDTLSQRLDTLKTLQQSMESG